MKCRKQRKSYRLEIASLWEVRLELDLWKRVVRVAREHKCSYSWITRYCVFKLVRREVLNTELVSPENSKSIAMEIHSNKNTPLHRHILCLYGDDEKLLRIAAMQLGLTVSRMIRLALQQYLPTIEKKTAKWEHIFYHGAKICKYFDHKRANILKMPFTDRIFYTKWSPREWWKRPEVTIPIPYTPTWQDLQDMLGPDK